MKNIRPIFCAALCAVITGGSVVPGAYGASANLRMNYQGFLTNTNGTPVNATKGVKFRIRDGSNGPVQWESVCTDVVVSSGILRSTLGLSNATGNWDTINWNAIDAHVEVIMGDATSCASAVSMSPQERLLASPYNLNPPVIPDVVIPDAILNRETLQAGATFYVSSGTVRNLNVQSTLQMAGSAGASGQLLQSNGPGSVPTWVNAQSNSAGVFESITLAQNGVNYFTTETNNSLPGFPNSWFKSAPYDTGFAPTYGRIGLYNDTPFLSDNVYRDSNGAWVTDNSSWARSKLYLQQGNIVFETAAANSPGTQGPGQPANLVKRLSITPDGVGIGGVPGTLLAPFTVRTSADNNLRIRDGVNMMGAGNDGVGIQSGTDGMNGLKPLFISGNPVGLVGTYTYASKGVNIGAAVDPGVGNLNVTGAVTIGGAAPVRPLSIRTSADNVLRFRDGVEMMGAGNDGVGIQSGNEGMNGLKPLFISGNPVALVGLYTYASKGVNIGANADPGIGNLNVTNKVKAGGDVIVTNPGTGVILKGTNNCFRLIVTDGGVLGTSLVPCP